MMFVFKVLIDYYLTSVSGAFYYKFRMSWRKKFLKLIMWFPDRLEFEWFEIFAQLLILLSSKWSILANFYEWNVSVKLLFRGSLINRLFTCQSNSLRFNARFEHIFAQLIFKISIFISIFYSRISDNLEEFVK